MNSSYDAYWSYKDKQKLIDIMFQIGLTIHTDPYFKDKTEYEVVTWIAGQLRDCGFDTEPMGASWGVLK